MRTLLSCLLCTSFLLTACQPKTNEAESNKEEIEEVSKKYTLTPFTPSIEYADATMQSMQYQDGKFNFTFDNYELGTQTADAGVKMCANSGQGQHIHLIVDTQPYAAKYTPNFDFDLEDGDYRILAFLSRSYHESIKNGKAFTAEKVSVVNKTITTTSSITEPSLFYSRPKGTYVGKANTTKVMLDFFLANVELGAEYKVKAMINDEEHLIDVWQPYYIEGLPMGENLITLSLVDGEGNKVDTPLNPVSRKFTLQADPAE